LKLPHLFPRCGTASSHSTARAVANPENGLGKERRIQAARQKGNLCRLKPVFLGAGAKPRSARCEPEFFVAQISKSAASPNCIRQDVENSSLAGCARACGLQIRDTAGYNLALRTEAFGRAPRFPRQFALANLRRGCQP
jgi:hypothetical protein